MYAFSRFLIMSTSLMPSLPFYWPFCVSVAKLSTVPSSRIGVGISRWWEEFLWMATARGSFLPKSAEWSGKIKRRKIEDKKMFIYKAGDIVNSHIKLIKKFWPEQRRDICSNKYIHIRILRVIVRLRSRANGLSTKLISEKNISI